MYEINPNKIGNNPSALPGLGASGISANSCVSMRESGKCYNVQREVATPENGFIINPICLLFNKIRVSITAFKQDTQTFEMSCPFGYPLVNVEAMGIHH